MDDHPEYCPVHGDPNDKLRAWPCPLAYEDGPPDQENCPHFAAELERRIAEVKAGNSYHLTELPDGRQASQEYRNHQPVGEPQIWHLPLDKD